MEQLTPEQIIALKNDLFNMASLIEFVLDDELPEVDTSAYGYVEDKEVLPDNEE